MLPSHAPELSAFAFQWLAAIDRYEADLERLMAGRWDTELFTQIADQFEQMRGYAAAFPRLQVTWVEMLITRFELTEALWHSMQAGSRRDGRVLGLHARHKTVIAELRRRCAFYLKTEA